MPDQILYFQDSDLPEQIRGVSDDIYNAIRSGLKNSKIVTIEYAKSPGNSKKRDILPEVLFHCYDEWYVAAYCYLRKEARTFRLDRITSAVLTERSAESAGIANDYRKNGIPWERDDDLDTIPTIHCNDSGYEVHLQHYYKKKQQAQAREKEQQQRQEGCNLIMHAEQNRIDLVKIDLKDGADINFSKGGSTALTAAACKGHLEMIKFLTSCGGDINQKTSSGDSILYCAVRYRQKEVIQYLLEELHCDPDEKNIYGWTPFTAAAMNHDCKTMEYLLEHEADINVTDQEGRSVLMVILDMDRHVERSLRAKTLRFLVEHGADIHARDRKERNALFHAIGTGDPKLTAYFLKLGVDVNGQDKHGRSLLHVAVEEFSKNYYNDTRCENLQKIVEQLCKEGIYLDSSDKNGITPLMLAKYGMFYYLLERGANPFAKDARNRSVAIHHAHEIRHIDTLADIGVDLFERDLDGNDVLMAAPCYLEEVKHYIEKYGFSCHDRNHVTTLLHRAACNYTSEETVKYLLERGADPGTYNCNHQTVKQEFILSRLPHKMNEMRDRFYIKELLELYEDKYNAEILRACCALDPEKLRAVPSDILRAHIKELSELSEYNLLTVVLDACENAMPDCPDARIEAIFDLLIEHGMDPVDDPSNDGISLVTSCFLRGKEQLAEKYLDFWLFQRASAAESLEVMLHFYREIYRYPGIADFLSEKLSSLSK